MGSEGYLLNQFLCARTNLRTDRWGGSIENRMRLPVEIVRRIRAAVGPTSSSCTAIRCSTGRGRQYLDDVVTVAKALQAGVTILNTGYGWHEARVPTIVTSVPRAAFASRGGPAAPRSAIPVVASNRINMPHEAEAIRAGRLRHDVDGAPFLADLTSSPRRRRPRRRNQYLHRLQPGLPRPHLRQQARQLPGNPRACHETELVYAKKAVPRAPYRRGTWPACPPPPWRPNAA
jgi:2,4-dienoyl-CoA reductase (NADPH2)